MSRIKSILLVLSIAFLSMPCFSQVRSEVLGVKLGVDSIQQVVETIERGHISAFIRVNTVSIEHITYAGVQWSGAKFYFVDDVVSAVEFFDIPSPKIAGERFITLGNMLMDKYPEYIKTKSPELIVISDGKHSIDLSYGSANMYFTLKYSVYSPHPTGYEDL